MPADLDQVARIAVRSYSFEVDERLPSGHPAHSLGQVLAQERGDLNTLAHPWRCFYEASSSFEAQRKTATEAVAIEANKLRNKWLVFYENCSGEDQLDLECFDPNMEGVVTAIELAVTDWNKKRQKGWRGKATSNFHKVCGTIDSHSNALKMLPSNNDYVSIFSGALTTIIQASVNHEKIVEGLAQALCEIGEYVRDCNLELDLFPTEQMQRLISDLYAHIFLFLGSVMDWIMQKKRKRLLDSFNQNFTERFKTDLEMIQHQAERIRQSAAQASRAEGRVSRLTLEDTGQQLRALRRDLRVGLEEIARERAEMAYRDRLRQLEVEEARRGRESVEQRALALTAWLSQMLQQGSQTLAPPLQILDRAPSPDLFASLNNVTWHSDQLLFNSRHFEDFFHRDQVRIPVEDTHSVTIPRDVLYHLTEWSRRRTTSCSLLWLKGEFSRLENLRNPLSLLASQFIQLLDRNQIPVVSYFCELRRNELLRQGNRTIEQQEMTSLAYALVRQMVELLLPEFQTTTDLSESRLKRLDGTVASWRDLLNLFADLSSLLPDTVYVVVDGLHWLDDRSTDEMVEELISCLKDHGKRLHVLLTTSGRSGVLLDILDVDEYIPVQNDLLLDSTVMFHRTDFLPAA